jgi:Zn-dependent protease with chaperone function/uncharacterized tellurite resistance protein B-like protein
MDFFGRQATARGRSRWLLGAFAVATGAVALALAFVLAVIVSAAASPEGQIPSASVDPTVFTLVAMATAAFIGIASLWRLSGLRSGGGAVAVALGGERVTGLEQDPLKRRLHNVVEEMSLAAGLPVPEVYVLENEPGINAFAAGLQPSNAAVAVTRGALERLTRDELQGVVAHEFSHILNGDMRLNARLMGYVFGLVAVSMVGRVLLRGGAYGGARARSSNRRGGGGAGALLAAGLAMVVLGSLGVLAGRILQAAVSRQREVLADASAVQFTRNPAGLANALKRIAASPLASSVRAVRREEIGHMLFATGRRSLAGLMATHPPVAERIRALDPNWKPGDAPPPLPLPAESTRTAQETAAAAREAGGALPRVPGLPGLPGLDPVAAAAMVGVVDLAMAQRMLALVPEAIHRAVLEPEGAAAISLALLLDAREGPRASQLAVLEARLGSAASDRIAQAAGHMADLAPTLRLALLDLASPALRHLPEARRDDLVHLAERLVELDGLVTPHEAALAAAIQSRLSPEANGKPDPEGALAMLALLARAGHEDDAEAEAAWTQGAAKLEAGGFPLPSPLPAYATVNAAAADATSHAARLAAMKERHRRLLMEAMADVAAHDGVIGPAELQLLRTAATALGCPMPPLDLQRADSTR